jgi:hypothetical protein
VKSLFYPILSRMSREMISVHFFTQNGGSIIDGVKLNSVAAMGAV